MKRLSFLLFSVGLIAVAWAVAAWTIAASRADAAARLAEQQAQWLAEKAELEAALQSALAQARQAPVTVRNPTTVSAAQPARPTPDEIMARLRGLKPAPGLSGARELRQAVYWLEELALAGPAALPAIRTFLARYEDVDLETTQLQGRAPRERVPLEFAIPPSLRLGLFEIVRRIGGNDAVAILAESLARTGRGLEVAYLAGALQEMAPNQYREQAIGAARALLAAATPTNPNHPLDRNHRDYLFGVLAFLGDTSFVTDAQAQLVRSDSQVDRGALRYLQKVLGAQAVPIVAQAYQSPLLTNSAGKEPLARLALNYVGADATANVFYQQTINDPLLTGSHRKNLIEDLNQDGFADTKNLTAQDLTLINNRIQLIEALAPKAMDTVNAAAFEEAYKDLLNMRAKLTGEKPGKP